MNGEIVLIDTNIIIDYLQEKRQAFMLFKIYDEKKVTKFISIITVIEVLVGILDAEKMRRVRTWLSEYFHPPIVVCSDIAYGAITLRQDFRLKVPDALIASTAQWCQGTLVTRDRDFKNIPGVQYPYFL